MSTTNTTKHEQAKRPTSSSRLPLLNTDILLDKLVQLPPRLHPNQLLHLTQLQRTEPLHILHLPHHIPIILRRNPRQAPQNLLRRGAEPRLSRSLGGNSTALLVRSYKQGFIGVGFRAVLFELADDVDGLVGGGGPDDAKAGEGDGEEDEFGADVGLGGAVAFGADLGVGLQREEGERVEKAEGGDDELRE